MSPEKQLKDKRLISQRKQLASGYIKGQATNLGGKCCKKDKNKDKQK